MLKLRLFLSFIVLLTSFNAIAQRTLIYSHEDALYKEAIRILEDKKFSIAQKKFKKVYENIAEPHSEIKMNAEYYVAFCALELFNKDAELLFLNFIEHHPQSPKVRLARFQLGKFYYRDNSWSAAKNWFSQVDVNELEPEEVLEFRFKYGYSLFKMKNFEEAQIHFDVVKKSPSVYQQPALFYYSYISYNSKFYENALEGFTTLRSDENFGQIVPYYIIQIYYLQDKFSEILEFGPKLFETAQASKAPEIARILAQAYYKKDNFEKSAYYLQFFMDKSNLQDSTSHYELAYSYYQLKDYDKAKKYFQKSSGISSEIGQYSLFYLGEIYLKQDNKQAARSAFRFASKTSYNIEFKENALFNYAKLSFELDVDPYHESIIALENYIEEYPNSKKVAEARKYLLYIYLNTKNYQRAIIALEKVDKKDLEVQQAYQKIAYYRAIELFNNEKIGFASNDLSNYKAAIVFFQKSLEFPIDNNITALAKYWKAESYYRLGNMKLALDNFNAFKASTGAIFLPEFKLVDYQIAYAYLGLNDYGPAIRNFRNFLTQHDGEKSKKVNDALIRTGDSYLVLKSKDDLLNALIYYKKALNLGLNAMDYCYFQMSQAYLLSNQYEKQAESLESLIETYPDSKFSDDARYNLGETYLVNLKNLDKAIKYFSDLVIKNPDNIVLSQKAYNGMATAYLNKKEIENSLKAFESSILLNPRSSQAFEAISGHKTICEFEIGNFQKHLDFRNNVGLPELSQASKDSSVFNAAKKFYLENDYPVAIKNLKAYLNAYPKALFVNQANYFLAESHLSLEQYNEALPYYEALVDLPRGEFSERAYYYSAKINFKNQEFAKASVRYLALEQISEYAAYVLEAQIGLMRCYKILNQNDKSIEYAIKVESNEKVSNLVKYEAVLQQGKAYMINYNYNAAIIAFKRAESLTQGEIGAESKYNIAYILYLKEQYEDSNLEIDALSSNYSSYKDWVTKGFLLMSDNFVKLGDNFQAKYILTYISENTNNPEFIKEVNKKINEIEVLESTKIVINPEVKDEVKVGDASEEDKKLFDTETPKE